jgi:hypothetical protein
MTTFTYANLLGWILAIFLGLLALIVLWKVFTDRIDLKYLIADEKGYASMSRFQFLIFTFVIAGGLIYMTLCAICSGASAAFPDVNNGVLVLLGISGGSYAIGKGLQNQADAQQAKAGEQANG